MANELRYRATIKDDVSGPLERIKDKFGQVKAAGAKPILQGLAIGAGIAAMNLLSDAVQNVTGWLVESVSKAREEEAGIARLSQAIKANVEGWDENSDAIEEVIEARERLAFSDGEQRDSLASLVAITKDVNKALDLQRQAMDLARLRGLDLATASELLGKVYAGNVSMLKRYGIIVRDGATATEALAEVQKATAGQAEAFANTTEGSMQGAMIALENLQEEIGQELLPILKDLAIWARDEGVPALRDMVDVAKELGPYLELVASGVDMLTTGGKGIEQDYQDAHDKLVALAEDAERRIVNGMAKSWETGSERIAMANAGIVESTSEVGREANIAERVVKGAFRGIVRAAEKTRDDLGKLGSEAADAYYDPLIAKAELSANKREQAEERATIASKKSTREQVRDARDRLLRLQKDAFQLQVELIGWGKMNKRQQESFLADLKRKWANSTGEAKSDIAALIRYIENLNAKANVDVVVRGQSEGRARRHAGGPVRGDFIAGEHGPELVRLGSSQNATVRPTLGGLSMGGGAMSLTINVNTPALTPGGAQALADAIGPAITRWQQQRGL